MSQKKYLCNICGHEAHTVATDFTSYMEYVYFDICYCGHCDTSFVDTVDTDLTSIYQHIYAQADQIPGYNRYYYYLKTIKEQPDPLAFLADQEAMYWAVKEALPKYNISKQQSILEVGSGLGYLTYALFRAGYNIKGVDISEHAVRQATAILGDHYQVADVFEMAERQQQYDFIILNEVIEHVPDPGAFVDALLKMLHPDGRLLITTPDKSVSIKDHPWDTDLPPVHLWWFSPTSMRTLAKQRSASIDFIDFTAFNRKHFDKMRFKIYTPYKRGAALDKTGKIIHPQSYTPVANSFKGTLQRTVAHLTAFEPFNSLLTRKEYPAEKNSTMACVLSHQQ